jgi:glycosyltransferase involved in cell wall biosynthesis
MVIHHHNKGMANDVDHLPYKLLMPMVYKNAKVILLSWHLYFDIEKVVPKENVLICPNGIDVEDFGQIVGREKENRVPHLLFLSNLMESKGVFVLLDALKILVGKGLSFYCDFVGGETKDIDGERFILEVNRRELGGFVIYNGLKYGSEKERYFVDADIFIHPTYNDCFPLVLLEAMQHGLPCITTSEGGIPDMVQDGVNGIICERQNAESLAAAIEKLLLNPELRKQMGQKGFEIFNQKFTSDKFESNLCECLKKAKDMRS